MRLFSEQGFDGTTTREIAEAAGINEALIFRHFPTKEDLYWAVVGELIEGSGRKQKIAAQLTSGGDDLGVLSEVARTFLRRTPADAALTRLLLFSALRNAELSDRFFQTYIRDCYEVMSNFIREGIAAGRFRPVDPLLAARSFFGMITYHFLVQEIFGGERYGSFDPEYVADEIARLWLRGVANEESARKAAEACFHTRADGSSLGTPTDEPNQKITTESK